MSGVFDLTAGVALVAAVLALTRSNAVHSLIYLVVCLVALAGVMQELGAHFAAALELVVYAGAIVVLFVFALMLLGEGPRALARERAWMSPRAWVGPSLLSGLLLAELVWVSVHGGHETIGTTPVGPSAVASALYGRYLLAVELASLLLMAGLVGTWHLGHRVRAARTET